MNRTYLIIDVFLLVLVVALAAAYSQPFLAIIAWVYYFNGLLTGHSDE